MRPTQNRHRPTANPAEVKKHLSSVDYPKDKQGLIDRVRHQRAPMDVLAVLETLPDREYHNADEVEGALEQGR